MTRLHCISPSDMAYILRAKDPFQSAANVPALSVGWLLEFFLLLFV